MHLDNYSHDFGLFGEEVNGMSDLISRQKAKDAIDMALDHIDHVPPWVYDNLLNALNEVPSVNPTHPTPSNTLGTLDCVERQKAMEIKFSSGFDHDGILYVPYRDVQEHLENLPSVQPRKGKWLPDNRFVYEVRFVCSCCKESEVVPTIGFTKYEPIWDFCPNCGADMRGDSDEN